MKSIFVFLVAGFSFSGAMGQSIKNNLPDSTKKTELAEVSCGKCKFGMPGKTCELAVRINGRAYYVDGAGIDDFGDAHEEDGFCNAVRKAKVQGEVVGNRFKLTYISLVPEIKTKEEKKQD